MKSATSSVRPRVSGGMGQGLGQFGEHVDEAAFQQALSQKSLSQAQANPAMAQTAAKGARQQQQTAMGKAKPPRAVGSLSDELIKRPWQDIWQEVRAFFSLNTWLGINPDTVDQEQKQKRVKIYQRMQSLNAEQEALVKKTYQEQKQKRKAEVEKEQKQKEAKAREQAATLPMPVSPRKGPIGPNSGKSKKQNAVALMQQQRRTMGQVGGSN